MQIKLTHACAHICWCARARVCVCVRACMYAHVTSIKCFLTLKRIHYFIASLSRKITSHAITHEWQGLQFTHACAHVCWCVCVCALVCMLMLHL